MRPAVTTRRTAATRRRRRRRRRRAAGAVGRRSTSRCGTAPTRWTAAPDLAGLWREQSSDHLVVSAAGGDESRRRRRSVDGNHRGVPLTPTCSTLNMADRARRPQAPSQRERHDPRTRARADLPDRAGQEEEGRSRPSTASTSTSPRARWSASSAPTARARPPRCGCSSTLLRPTAGTATVDGYDIVRESLQVRRCIGYVSQAGTHVLLRPCGRGGHGPRDALRDVEGRRRAPGPAALRRARSSRACGSGCPRTCRAARSAGSTSRWG